MRQQGSRQNDSMYLMWYILIVLDPDNTAVTLESLERLAAAVGRQLRIELA